MTLGPEKLDVYRLSIGSVVWVYEKAAGLNGVQRPARDQWLRVKQSISIAISIWRDKTGSPSQALPATLDSAPERRRYEAKTVQAGAPDGYGRDRRPLAGLVRKTRRSWGGMSVREYGAR